jgi:hypothetical protein
MLEASPVQLHDERSCGLGWTGTRKPPGCKQQAKTVWAIGQRVGCRNVTLRRAGRIITRVPTPKPFGFWTHDYLTSNTASERGRRTVNGQDAGCGFR